MQAVEESEYDASSLQVLEGLAAVRKRAGMYIGSTDSRGLQHCVWEIVDNAVDEALAGFCSRIAIVLAADGSVEVSDDGRGIPPDVEPRTGLSGIEVVFTKLHAGGKFGSGAYAVAGGLHGVGAAVVNALSSRVDVRVTRSGAVHGLSFCEGAAGHFDEAGFAPGTVRVLDVAPAGASGTVVRFWPDRSIFLPEATVDLHDVLARARQTAFLVPGLTLTVRDERVVPAVEETFSFAGGVADLVGFLAPDEQLGPVVMARGEGTFTETVPVLEGTTMVSREVVRTCQVEVGLRWGTGYDTVTQSFVNVIATPGGGTHVSGFERALLRSVNEAARQLKALKASEEAVNKEDVLEGLTAVVLVRLPEPQFEGQTKQVLGTAAVAGVVQQVVADRLAEFFSSSKSKSAARLVLDKVANAARARRAARLQRETVRRKNALESSSLPAKLSDCRARDTERSELFIIEGDSAGGTVKAARDSEFQALLPIRGKILNTMRASEKQMLDNAECAAIISAIGAGSGRSFDVSAARYGKLIVLADADVDGAHIRCLLLTLAYRYMRPMLEAGMVFAAVPPLYGIKLPGGMVRYAHSDAQRDAILAELESAGQRPREVQRYKGLGEMDADQLAETTLDASRRRLRRMTMRDAAQAARSFEMLMGQDVGARRDFIVSSGGLLDPAQIDA